MIDGVDGGRKMEKNFVIGADDTRATNDFFLWNRLLEASEAWVYTGGMELICWI
jgi:hypothetical protein